MRTSVRSAVLGICVLTGLLGSARAAPSEPLLFLGVVRGPQVDKLATQIVTEHLTDRQENVLTGPPLYDADRRCRRAQCLGTLATARKAELVLSGDVSEVVGAKSTLRVLMHLYDARRREVLDQENLCADCDDTKLGILLTSTTSELLLRYRKAASATDQVNSLLDTLEKEKQASGRPGAPVPVPAPGPAVNNGGSLGTSAPPLPVAPPPPLGSPPGVLPMVPPGVLPLPSQALPPPISPPLSGQSPVQGERPVAYPTPLPPPPTLPPQSQPLPPGALTADMPPPATAPRRGLSPKRKAIAGVFGALGVGTLVTSIVLTALDQRLDPSLSYNPSGAPCQSPELAGRSCVISMVRLWGPGYGLSALLLGGMVLTLALPESHGPASSSAAGSTASPTNSPTTSPATSLTTGSATSPTTSPAPGDGAGSFAPPAASEAR